MKKLKFILLAACAVFLFGACSNKDEYGVEFSKTGLYFEWSGEPQTVSYVTKNVALMTLKSATTGWTCNLNQSARTVTITPPAKPESESSQDEQRDADIVFTITSKEGKTSQYTLDCYIIGDKMTMINADRKFANSYVLTTPKTAYTLDVSCNGGGEPISGIEDVQIVWQSHAAMIEHLSYDKETSTVTFYIDALTEKDDDDVYVKENGEYVMRDGNAVIAVVDGSENIIWSWHLWFAKASNNPLEDYSTYSNGVTFMNRNLGAYGNSNGETDNTNKILDSYGLYYQWGRKDPFLRPYYHDCAGNEDEYVYSSSSSSVYVECVETSAQTGTVEYAVAHPMTFITNAAAVDAETGNGVGDWLHSADNSLWNSSKKSTYDPCPYGWRVPAAGDFDVLSLTASEDATPLETARKRFGWMLTDGNNNYFYLGGGFRSYFNGTINNMNYKDGVYPSQPEPWEGYYWTCGVTADGKQSTCMYFDLTTTRTINKFSLNYPSKRANAMQIRCVKIK